MKAIALQVGTSNIQIIGDFPEPAIAAPDEIKLRVLAVGICGTDREEAAGGRAQAPAGQDRLVIGHEMLGQVAEVGSTVTRVKVGDHALFTVRRGGCGGVPALLHEPPGHVPDRQVHRARHLGSRRLSDPARRR